MDEPAAPAYGVVRPAAGGAAFCAARVGGLAVPLEVLAPDVPSGTWASPRLNGLLALGAGAWRDVDDQVRDAVARRDHERSALPLDAVVGELPVAVADYVDFFASEAHVTNVSRLFRPGADPVPPAWRTLPQGYHGRAGSVVVSGTPVRRPAGLLPPAAEGEPSRFGPEPWLDVELELGFVLGDGPEDGAPLTPGSAGEVIFGVVLVNDWSGRAIQRWESVPLGPFLGKSFATSMSAWIVPWAALAPFRVDGPRQDPPPAPHLAMAEPRALDLALELEIDGTVLSRPNARELAWSPEQMLAHLTSNGAGVRAGDVVASGTVSGWEPGAEGSLLELSRGGTQPVALGDGRSQTFLADGDEVVLRGRAGKGAGRVELGEVRGRVEPCRVAA